MFLKNQCNEICIKIHIDEVGSGIFGPDVEPKLWYIFCICLSLAIMMSTISLIIGMFYTVHSLVVAKK